MYRFRGEKDLLFSGDVQTIGTHLVGPAAAGRVRRPRPRIHLRRSKEHPDRKETERRFRDRVAETVERGGKAIMPAFAVGRAQEVLMALAHSGFEVYLDGMARSVNHIYSAAPEYLADPRRSSTAPWSRSTWSRAPPMRRHVVRDADVIVTTGGMLDGGPVLHYIGEFHRDANSSIFLTGYQVEGSNGRQLMDDGTLTIDEVTVRPACDVEKFDFSAHAGHSDLVKLVQATGAKTVVLMHGDQREKLAAALEGLGAGARCRRTASASSSSGEPLAQGPARTAACDLASSWPRAGGSWGRARPGRPGGRAPRRRRRAPAGT